jgi:hypothetical protein
MAKTLVERLLDHSRPATETQERYTLRRNEERAEAAAEITRLASRIEELERHLTETARIGEDESKAGPLNDFERGVRIARIVAGEEAQRVLSQALSDPTPVTHTVKQLGAARYLYTAKGEG